MDFKDIFIGEKRDFRPDDSLLTLIKDGWMGIVIATLLGWFAIYLSSTIKISGKKYFDALMIAVILGMIVRYILSKVIKEEQYAFKIVPGIMAAKIALLPVAIIFYGAKNFNIKVVADVAAKSPMALVKLILLVTIVFVVIYYIGKAFRLPDKLVYLLGFGSAVCGTSAIAVTAPICKADADDTSSALIINTLVVIAGLFLFTNIMLPNMSVESYTDIVGSLTFQTDFTKMALDVMDNPQLHDFGMNLKAIRISLLLFSIPIVVYLLRKKLFIPWYMVLFFVTGAILSYASLSKGTMTNIENVYKYLFPVSLAAVGLNADIRALATRFWRPLTVVVITFIVSILAFFLLGVIF